jgi:AhpD family alkylhydroperoxidase
MNNVLEAIGPAWLSIRMTTSQAAGNLVVSLPQEEKTNFSHWSDSPLVQTLKDMRSECTSLERHIPELIRLRAAIIHHCQLCIDTQVEALRLMGQSEERILEVSRWRESTLYNPKERAALAMTDALAPEPSVRMSKDMIREVAQALDQPEIVEVALVIHDSCDVDSKAVASWPSEAMLRDRFRLAK